MSLFVACNQQTGEQIVAISVVILPALVKSSLTLFRDLIGATGNHHKTVLTTHIDFKLLVMLLPKTKV